MSSSSSSSSSEMTYFCPRCGDKFNFSSVPELQAHLVSRHTYETLLVLSQARLRSSRAGALLPLARPAGSRTRGCRPGADAHGLPLPLACLDLASSSASMRLLREAFGPTDGSVLAAVGPADGPSTALALPGSPQAFPGKSLSEVGVQLGLELGLTVSIGLEERLGLGLDRKIAQTFAEMEERVNRRVGRLKAVLQRREAELERERRDAKRLRSEKQEVEERAAYLSRQVSVAMEMMERLKEDLQGRESELKERQQEMLAIQRFLNETAEKEADAKSRLQVFIETLLERVDRAETHLLLLSSHTRQHGRTHAAAYTPAPARAGRRLAGSADDLIAHKMQGAVGNRRSYSVSGCFGLGEQLPAAHGCSGPTGRTRTSSLGSGGGDGEGAAAYHHAQLLLAQSWWHQDGAGDRRTHRRWEGGWRRTRSKISRRHHSTEEEDEGEEEEEEEEEDFEEEDDGDYEEEGLWSSPEMRSLVFSRMNTPASDLPSSRSSSPSHHCGYRQLGAGTLRLRAGLLCVFPYLDARSLLRAAEVCCDWRFVARHPAVWTHLRLDNARVSAKFLATLSQWCTQTQSVVLNNLKPRSRRASETPEDYLKNTRGCVEPGVESLLRSAGGSLRHLSVIGCPHIVTERCVWLASCYCRNLEALAYRSSSDPLGQEVLWALGAGCRSISSLQVAPAHPCQQPTRFGNRCLQTIGRCWPHLRSLSVGGAGCGTQGLVDVVRSCADLQELELERITDLGLQVATELCDGGLRSLQTLILTHTPVSGQALLHFLSARSNIRRLVLEVAATDYFEDPDTEEARRLFGEILGTLKVLQKRPGLSDVLQINVEGFC